MVIPDPAQEPEGEKKDNVPDNPSLVLPVDVAPPVRAANLRDPSIRFVDVGYGIEGSCPLCMRDGEVGRFCFECCHQAGMMVGKCPSCEEVGVLGEGCPMCAGMAYEAPMEMGECPECNGAGTRYTMCLECEDQSSMYE